MAADKTIDSGLVVMSDIFWPGVAQLGDLPTDGWTGASHHNVVSPVYPVGTKIMRYHYNSGGLGAAGWYTMIYLRAGTQGATVMAAKSLCCPQDATMTYKVTNDADTAKLTIGGVYAISAMTNNYYGWFLCHGVFPTDDVAALDGNLLVSSAGLTAVGRLIGVKTTVGGANDDYLILVTAAAAGFPGFGYPLDTVA